MNKKVYIIWIWWIWVSWIARYYNHIWWEVYWSDLTNSELIENLKTEKIDIFIWERSDFITWDIDLVIYTEAIPKENKELQKALKLNIKTLTYPEALALISNDKKLIAISWSHWKSTTTSMISILMQNSKLKINTIVWSLLKEFGGKNSYFSDSEYFSIEACEYKRSFLKYTPYIWIITNIDLDHLDYYKNLEDYIDAFECFINNIKTWWYIIINWYDNSSLKLVGKRKNINYVIIYNDYYEIIDNDLIKKYNIPDFTLKIPWKHILFDAKIAYTTWKIIWLSDDEIINSLTKYNGIWRRSEIIWETLNWNILMSDYGHHPTEIKLNLEALKNKYMNREIVCIFQPHQYNRTLELLNDFKDSFLNCDLLIVPNIYKSRDTLEDMQKINWESFLNYINLKNKIFWNWLNNTLEIIKKLDIENPWKYLFILQWAWDIDNLRYDIEIKRD